MAKKDDYVHQEKQKALFAAYKEARKKLYEQNVGSGRIHSLAVLHAIRTPQKRFWLDPYRVYRTIQEYVLHGRTPKTWGTRSELYQDIIDAYNRLKDKRMFKGMPLSFIASFVTYEPSRGFYMSQSRAGRMISDELNRLRKLHSSK